MDGLAKYHLFQALFRSRVAYAVNLLSPISTKIRTWFEGYYYRAIKSLLGVKENAKTEKLLSTCLGMSFEDYIMKETKNTYARMLNKADELRKEKIQEIMDFFEVPTPNLVEDQF